MSFSTDHLSIYAIGYNKFGFKDIDDSSAKENAATIISTILQDISSKI